MEQLMAQRPMSEKTEKALIVDPKTLKLLEKLMGHRPTKPRYTKVPRAVLKERNRRRNRLARASRKANR